ncbi:MAG: hypothetical protein PARBA_03042 [Parabacteroides sp.]
MKRENLLLLLGCVSFFSCTQVELTPAPDKVGVSVHPDWGSLTPASGMEYCFYPTAGGGATEIEGTGGGCETTLPPGSYRLLAYNTGTANISFTGMESYDTAAAEAVPTAAKTRAGGMTFVKQPSVLYAGTSPQELEVPRLDPVEVQAGMKQLTRTLKLSFNLDDMEGVEALEGYFNGVYPSLLLSTGEATEAAKEAAPRVATAFFAPVTPTATTVEVSLLGLLDPEGGTAYRSTLRLTLKGADGWRQQADVDLTHVLTDIFKAGGEGLVLETPAIEIRVKLTSVSLSAAVESWTTGTGGGIIYYTPTAGLQD